MIDEPRNPETQSLTPDSGPAGVLRRHAIQQKMEAHPERIGPYRILETLGEGGMGVVYLAEQTQPIHRRVALKIIKLGMDTKQVIARFETEREALALMNHPHVAKVFDAGATEQGRPYFVMEHVPGIPITDYCDKHRVTTEDRLRLFMDVCAAIQHAHQKGIIHRDIKPSNVLVTVQDGKPTVKVIDFGVAKATQHRLAEHTVFTEQGQLIGTPGYMSPEQAEMTALDIDTRTDVYSLGVLLYGLLVGSLPFDNKLLLKAGLAEIQRIIRQVDPPKPSTKFSSLSADSTTIAHQRHTEPRTLARLLRGDLDWIVMKCLEKDRTRRYDTANGLALEIQRYLNSEPVLAGPPTVRYRFRKLVRRNKGAVAAGLIISTVLVGGLIGTSYGLAQAVRARKAETQQRVIAEKREREAVHAREAEAEQRRIAEANEQRARKEADKTAKFADFMEETLNGVEPSVALGRDTKMLKELMDSAAKRIDAGELSAVPEAELRLRLTIGGVYRGIAEFNSAERMLGPAVDLAERAHGHDSAERALALNEYAAWLMSGGRDAEALPKYQESLAMHQRLFPGDHPDVATSLKNVARCLDSLGRSAEALPMMVETLAMRQRLFPGDHPDVASGMNFVAFCLDSLGRLADALPKYEEALAMRRRLFPGDHPNVAESLNNVACCLLVLGRSAEALPKAEEALAMNQRLFPSDHPEVATNLNNIASCLQFLGRTAEALPKYEESLAMRQRLFPGDHPDVGNSLNNVAVSLEFLGRTAEALPKAEEALSMFQRLFPDDHSAVATADMVLAYCLNSLDRSAEALPRLEQSLAIFARIYPSDHSFIRLAEVGKGRALVQLERYQEAKDLLVPLWESIADRPDVDRPIKVICLRSLARLFEELETIEPEQGHAAEGAKYRLLLASLEAQGP